MGIVGLTGGIASGKSTVSNLFKGHGVPVVDTGHFARDILKKGIGGRKDVVAAFGEDILLANGDVDKAKLCDIVFSDPDKNQLLKRMDKWTNAIIVVWIDPETQLQRFITRDKISIVEARNRIQAQIPLRLKKTKADVPKY